MASQWQVVAVNDDGTRDVRRAFLSPDQAEEAAGRMRDESTEFEIASGWNYLAEAMPKRRP